MSGGFFQPDEQFTAERHKPHEQRDSSIRFFGHVLDEPTPGELIAGIDGPRRHDFDRSANVIANTVLVLIHRPSVARDRGATTGDFAPRKKTLPAGAIPRTTSGKLARRACRAEYLNGTLGVR
jgi:acyl-CoA synthetase (AMP-forming)/AMP-acid ligase II